MYVCCNYEIYCLNPFSYCDVIEKNQGFTFHLYYKKYEKISR